MKKGTLISVSMLLVMMVILPSFAILFKKAGQTPIDKSQNNDNGVSFKVYLPDAKRVEKYSAEEYLFGVIAGEMNMTYEDEALKAQTVAAYTLALYRKNQRDKKPDDSILKADLTADSSVDQAFLTTEQVKEKWGEKYSEYSSRLKKIISSVFGKYLTYNGEIAQTVYHDTSGGKTESAKNMWGSEIPYLVSVQSVGDLLNPDYVSKVSVPLNEFLRILSENGIKMSEVEPAKNTEIISRSDSGTVLSIKLGDKSVKGSEIRQMFNLRSSNFDILYKEDSAEFTVCGYGHGVGMSQYGANVMAQQGSSYEDILLWYYKGCKIAE